MRIWSIPSSQSLKQPDAAVSVFSSRLGALKKLLTLIKWHCYSRKRNGTSAEKESLIASEKGRGAREPVTDRIPHNEQYSGWREREEAGGSCSKARSLETAASRLRTLTCPGSPRRCLELGILGLCWEGFNPSQGMS